MKQKKLIITIVLIFIFTIILPVMVIAKTGIVNDANIRVRTGPSTSGTETIENLYTGDRVEILGEEGDWYKVKTPSGKTGYMYAKFIDVSQGSSTTNPKPEKAPKVTGVTKMEPTTYITTADSVNIRPHNSTKYASIGSVTKGEKITVIGKIGDWLQIKYSTDAFVHGDFFEVEKQEKPETSKKTEKPNETKKPKENKVEKPEKTEKKTKLVLTEDISGKYMPALYSRDKGKAKKDKDVVIELERGKWTKISSEKESFWVITENLRVKKVELETKEKSN